MKVVLLVIFVLNVLGISACEKVHGFEERDVVFSIYDGGRNHTHKAPCRKKEIYLKITAQSICVESGIEKSQISTVSFYSDEGYLIYTKQCVIGNGDVIPVESNVMKETSRISIFVNGKEYIGIL